MQLVVLGVGDAFTAKHYSSSLLVLAGENGDAGRLLIDFPDPPRKVLHEAAQKCGLDLRLETIQDAVLTHLHGDHVNGLEAVGFYKHFVEAKRLRLYAAEPVMEDLWHGRLRAAMGRVRLANGAVREPGIDDYFEAHTLSERAPTQIGPFTVEIHPTVHHVPCYGLRIRCGERTLAYSSDTAHDLSLIAWLEKNSHLIVHETNLGTHTPYEALLGLPPEVRRRMRLIHYPDDFDVERSAIECLREGQIYEV